MFTIPKYLQSIPYGRLSAVTSKTHSSLGSGITCNEYFVGPSGGGVTRSSTLKCRGPRAAQTDKILCTQKLIEQPRSSPRTGYTARREVFEEAQTNVVSTNVLEWTLASADNVRKYLNAIPRQD